MKKFLILIPMLLFGGTIFAQQTIKFEKIGSYGSLSSKVNGFFTITDSTLRVYSEKKGIVADYTLVIVSKDENQTSSTYNCLGQIGAFDKHQIVFTFKNNIAIWNSINTFSEEKLQQFVNLSKN
jgi:hypothetical protein